MSECLDIAPSREVNLRWQVARPIHVLLRGNVLAQVFLPESLLTRFDCLSDFNHAWENLGHGSELHL